VVRPGDLIVGDHDGIVVVPYEAAAQLLPELRVLQKNEEQLIAQIKNNTVDRSWVDDELKSRGYTL
jgi:regulator of RNase E activity RraA